MGAADAISMSALVPLDPLRCASTTIAAFDRRLPTNAPQRTRLLQCGRRLPPQIPCFLLHDRSCRPCPA